MFKRVSSFFKNADVDPTPLLQNEQTHNESAQILSPSEFCCKIRCENIIIQQKITARYESCYKNKESDALAARHLLHLQRWVRDGAFALLAAEQTVLAMLNSQKISPPDDRDVLFLLGLLCGHPIYVAEHFYAKLILLEMKVVFPISDLDCTILKTYFLDRQSPYEININMATHAALENLSSGTQAEMVIIIDDAISELNRFIRNIQPNQLAKILNPPSSPESTVSMRTSSTSSNASSSSVGSLRMLTFFNAVTTPRGRFMSSPPFATEENDSVHPFPSP